LTFDTETGDATLEPGSFGYLAAGASAIRESSGAVAHYSAASGL